MTGDDWLLERLRRPIQRVKLAAAMAPNTNRTDCVVTRKKQTQRSCYKTRHNSERHLSGHGNVETSGTGIGNDRSQTLGTEHRLPAQKHIPLLRREMGLEPEEPKNALGADRKRGVDREGVEIQLGTSF